MKNNKISILMTAYNAEEFIGEAISSIINQTLKNWNLILVDDKSTDGTIKIVKSFKNKRIKIYKLKKHIGRTNALNYGLKKCKSRYVAIQDADDISLPNRFKKQLEFLEKNKNFKMTGGWALMINRSGKKIGEIKSENEVAKLSSSILFHNNIPHSTVMYCTSYAKKIGGYPSHLKYAQDFGLILNFLKRGKIKIMPKFASKIRFTSESMSFRKEYKNIVVKDDLKLLDFVKNNFYLTKLQILKYYFLKMKYKIKLVKNYFI